VGEIALKLCPPIRSRLPCRVLIGQILPRQAPSKPGYGMWKQPMGGLLSSNPDFLCTTAARADCRFMLAWLFYEDGNLGSLIVLSAHLRLQLRDMYEFDVRIYQRAIYTTSGITLNNDHQPTTQMYFPCPGAATKPLNLPDLLNKLFAGEYRSGYAIPPWPSPPTIIRLLPNPRPIITIAAQ